ncbi:MAG: hypothetical protein J4F32_05500 [Dehalococcoidia bacterium]|nr:hypothetical protein [Dehalococcoidia bacterium]
MALLLATATLIPLAGLIMVMMDNQSLMWLMAVGFFLGLLLLVGGAFLADKAARQ